LLELEGAQLRVLERAEQGLLQVEIRHPGGVAALLDRHGQVPLPPYIERAADQHDVERYQTVFAAHTGSVAAPTAGLHFSASLLERLRQRGIELAAVTLHVGLGTFRPVSVEDLDQHPMHSETFEVSPELAQRVNAARGAGRVLVAVGTTVVRALESAVQEGRLAATRAATRLLIQPGYRFQVVDALFTNFHAPRSTLLALVSAFAGIEPVRAAYQAALAGEYRFLSYGDAMWLPTRAERIA
jgi:S-adenosylmethionine:tRNA ribosyltransferase-isomerase